MANDVSADEILEASQGVRARSIAMLRSGGEQQAATIVATCPRWTTARVVTPPRDRVR